MAETELQVILKAMELSEHTLRLTSNCNRYPKKYRFSLVDKMQNKCLCIYESLMEANRTDIREYKRERLELQTKAITYCDGFKFRIITEWENTNLSVQKWYSVSWVSSLYDERWKIYSTVEFRK